MPNYEVGDTVEELDPATGVVVDAGVVTRVEKYSLEYQLPEDVRKIYAKWEHDLRLPELSFSSDDPMFRNNTERKVEPEITLKTVTKVLDVLVDCVGSSFLPTTISNCAEIVYQQIQKEQQELQRQNDPEYQKYLELKKKFEIA